MKCCDHPKINAVALLHQEDYSIAVCVDCLKSYKRDMNEINKLGSTKPVEKINQISGTKKHALSVLFD